MSVKQRNQVNLISLFGLCRCPSLLLEHLLLLRLLLLVSMLDPAAALCCNCFIIHLEAAVCSLISKGGSSGCENTLPVVLSMGVIVDGGRHPHRRRRRHHHRPHHTILIKVLLATVFLSACVRSLLFRRRGGLGRLPVVAEVRVVASGACHMCWRSWRVCFEKFLVPQLLPLPESASIFLPSTSRDLSKAWASPASQRDHSRLTVSFTCLSICSLTLASTVSLCLFFARPSPSPSLKRRFPMPLGCASNLALYASTSAFSLLCGQGTILVKDQARDGG